MPGLKSGKTGKGRRGLVLLLSLAAVIVAAGAAYFATISPQAPQATPTPAATEPPALVTQPVHDVTAITVGHAEEGYTLLSGSGTYALDGFPDFSVDQSKARDLALACAYLYYEDVIDAPGSLADFGLDNPAAVVTVRYAENAERTFLLGNKTPSGARYYLMEQGDQAVYIVYASTGESFMTPRRALHTVSMPQIKAGGIARVSLTVGGAETVTVGFEPERETAGISALWLTEPFVYEADSERVSTYFDQIAGIRLTGFEDDASPERLSQYGLDAPRYRLTVHETGADGKATPTLTLHIGTDEDEKHTYARIDETNAVYLLDRSSVAFLSDISAAGLVDRYVNLVSLAKTDAIEVQANDLSIRLEIDRQTNPGTDAYSIGGKAADAAEFRGFFQMLIGLQADGLLPAGWSPNEGTSPTLTVTYFVNTAMEMERIEYLPYDANHYAVRRNGVCLLYILRSRVDGIPEIFHAYASSGSEKETRVPSPGTL